MNTPIQVLVSLAFVMSSVSEAQEAPVVPKIMMINMGGNDCPPCLAWRRFELPKLQMQADFQSIEYVHVEKTIYSAVPARFFLPSQVKPYKEKLDVASGSMSGSPQVAILVNGEVYDYIYGTRTAEDILKIIRSIQASTPYPFERCLQRRDRSQCAIKAS